MTVENASEQERAMALAHEGLDAMNSGDNATARRCFEESRAIREAIGDQIGVGKALNNLANVSAQEGDEEGAQRLWQQSLELQRSLNNPAGTHCPLANMSSLAFRQGNYARMREMDEQLVALARTEGTQASLANSLDSLTLASILLYDYSHACSAQKESLEIKRALGGADLPYSLKLCAEIAKGTQQWEQAVLFYGARETRLRASDRPQHPQEQAEVAEAMANLERSMGVAAYRASYSTGKLMTMEQALTAAVEFCADPAVWSTRRAVRSAAWYNADKVSEQGEQ